MEAPASGSLILARILLKLETFGLIPISLIGGIIIRLSCIMQTNIKSIIAYSSVANIGLVIGVIIT